MIILSIVFPENKELNEAVGKCLGKFFEVDSHIFELAEFMNSLKYETVAKLNPVISKSYFNRLHELSRPSVKCGVGSRLKFEYDFIGKIEPKER